MSLKSIRKLFEPRRESLVWMGGSDTRMDQQGNRGDPINPLPVRCARCGFVDVDHVPQPYLLSRARAGSPSELAPAEMGCFLVRERARRVLDAAVSGQVRNFPTAYLKGGDEATPWSLAVPVHLIDTFRPKPTVPRCPTCGEPRTAHYGSQCVHDGVADAVAAAAADAGWDVARSRQWTSGDDTAEFRSAAVRRAVYRETKDPKYRSPAIPRSARDNPSPEHPWTREAVDRALYFSRRLALLFRRLKLRGLEPLSFYDMTPTPEEAAWVDERAAVVNARETATRPAPPGKPDARAWFNHYLRQHRRAKPADPVDFAAVERRRGVRLPADYKRFIDAVGGRTFRNVTAQEGFDATVVRPSRFDWTSYRSDARPAGGAVSRVDGVMFAVTGHGDCFVFDVTGGTGGNYPVYHYDHETDAMVPFADDFAACVRRLAEAG